MQRLIQQARVDRTALIAMANNTDVKVVTTQGQMINSTLCSGEAVIGANGSIVSTAQACKVCQLRDFHSHDRGKRFHVYRLRDFQRCGDGHDVMWGTVMLVKWGDTASIFAVVRVLGILTKVGDELRQPYSTQLNSRDSDQAFIVELLDPVGAVRQSGGQEYKASGYQLPKIAAKMVLKIVSLLHMDAVDEEGQHSHTALLLAADIQAMENEGYRRTSAADGYVHIQNLREMEQDRDSGVMWNATKGDVVCCFCLSSMYDDSTGVMVKCVTCGDVYHQQCHTPVLQTGSFRRDRCECAVCSGADPDVCRCCGKNWTDSLKGNRLIKCDGPCGCWWHQKCHLPPATNMNLDAPWFCHECEVKQAQQSADEAVQEHGRATRRSARQAVANRTVGWTRGNTHGLRLSDGGSNLAQAVWDRRGKHK